MYILESVVDATVVTGSHVGVEVSVHYTNNSRIIIFAET